VNDTTLNTKPLFRSAAGRKPALTLAAPFLVLLALVLSACGGSDAEDATVVTGAAVEDSAGTPVPTVVPTVQATAEPKPTLIPTATPLPTVAPPTSTPTPTPQPERTEPAIRPPGDWDSWTVTAKNETVVVRTFDAPDGNEFQLKYEYLNGGSIDYPLANPTFYNNPLALSVVEGEPGDEWIKIQAPIRPQDTFAWVKADQFEWSESNFYVEIDVATTTVRAWEGDKLITESQSVQGSSRTPTPLLSGYIDEKVPGPNSAYGPWVLTLATFSEAHNTFGGGLPKIALHGTNNPGIIGQYASNGCIRLPNDVIQFLADTVPVGTRVAVVNSAA